MVSWQEASGDIVAYLDDFKTHRVEAFATMKDLTLIRQSASTIDAADSNVKQDI